MTGSDIARAAVRVCLAYGWPMEAARRLTIPQMDLAARVLNESQRGKDKGKGVTLPAMSPGGGHGRGGMKIIRSMSLEQFSAEEKARGAR